jgi:hypothetical protein
MAGIVGKNISWCFNWEWEAEGNFASDGSRITGRETLNWPVKLAEW